MEAKQHDGLDDGVDENNDDEGEEIDGGGAEEADISDKDPGSDEEVDAGNKALGCDVDPRSKPDVHDGTLGFCGANKD
jgi:hypothetical protein